MKTNLSRNPNVYKQLAQDCARLKLTEPQRQRQQWKASGLLQSLNLAEEALKGRALVSAEASRQVNLTLSRSH